MKKILILAYIILVISMIAAIVWFMPQAQAEIRGAAIDATANSAATQFYTQLTAVAATPSAP